MHIIALALLTLTLNFTGPTYPAPGTVYVLEVGPATYSCATVATRCIFAVDAAAFNLQLSRGLGVCFYPRARTDARQCQWFVDMKVQRPKRRIAK